MKRINLLQIPVLLCKGLSFLLVVAAICITLAFIHIQIDPLYYSGWNAGLMSQNGVFSYKVFESWHIGVGKQENLLSFDRIKRMSLCFNYLQLIGIISLTFLTTKEFLTIIRSVELIEAFHQKSVESFTKMSKYLFVIFILLSVTIVNAQEANLYSYVFQPTPLILSIAALIMAEIFKQGNRLLEDNQLTI